MWWEWGEIRVVGGGSGVVGVGERVVGVGVVWWGLGVVWWGVGDVWVGVGVMARLGRVRRSMHTTADTPCAAAGNLHTNLITLPSTLCKTPHP